jgi:glycogen debranching enzyme
VACHPQAWAAGALPYLLTTILGLQPDAFARRLTVRSPRLPAGIEWVELRALPIADGTADLRFDRTDTGTATVAIVATSRGVTVDVSA